MKRKLVLLSLMMVFAVVANVNAQETKNNEPFNGASEMLADDGSKLTIGGYGQIDFNQAFGGTEQANGKMDVHRMVMLFGYQFNDRVDFVTEIEFEHVKEVFVEQAFIRYKINDFINFRAGLLLIPMGIINEYHEPVTFNGVERPNVAGKIVPTTWREIGAGFSGKFMELGLKYQVYLVNGFLGYNGDPKISGEGVRSGRQKGAESVFTTPNLSFKLDYYGMNRLKLGLAGYFGKTQSTLFDGLDNDEPTLVAQADSSVVSLSLIGIDARYNYNGFAFRGAYFMGSMSNTDQYNAFTESNAGSAFTGFYVEASYDLFRLLENTNNGLIAFVRYENFNTQSKVEAGTTLDDKYAVQEIVTGLGFKIANGVMLKADVQFAKNRTQDEYSKTFNAGVAVWF